MSSTKVDKKTFNKADPDKDGTLTKDEYLTIVKSRFEAADPDHDGTVSVDETQVERREGTRASVEIGVREISPHFWRWLSRAIRCASTSWLRFNSRSQSSACVSCLLWVK